jgi:hypothetical protein
MKIKALHSLAKTGSQALGIESEQAQCFGLCRRWSWPMTLHFSCPHCGAAESDPWELLDADCVQVIRCDHCAEHHYLAVMDCAECTHETVFSFRNRPAAGVLRGLRCERCSRQCAGDGSASDDQATEAAA